MDELELLEQLGFTKCEGRLYLALVEQGPATVGSLVQRTRIHTSVVYTALQRLSQRGLVTYAKKGRAKTISATDPRALLEQTAEVRKELETFLPQWVKQLAAKSPEIAVEVFEGFPGLTTLFNGLFAYAKPSDLYLSFTLGQEFEGEACLKWFNNLGRRRMALKLDVKALCPVRFRPLFENVGDSHILRKTSLRFSQFEFPQGIVIFHDSVIFISCSPSAKAIRIKDRKLAEQYRTFFMQLYATGMPYVRPKH